MFHATTTYSHLCLQDLQKKTRQEQQSFGVQSFNVNVELGVNVLPTEVCWQNLDSQFYIRICLSSHVQIPITERF